MKRWCLDSSIVSPHANFFLTPACKTHRQTSELTLDSCVLETLFLSFLHMATWGQPEAVREKSPVKRRFHS